MSFQDLGLSEALLRAIADQGYNTPSPVQSKAIPQVLAGRDVMAAAQTGTGKTAAFTLPLLQNLSGGARAPKRGCRALVLTPTRELAAQVHENVTEYSRYLDLRSACVFGGVKINPQIDRLSRGVDVLVATPGRLLDLQGQGAVDFSALEILVLDEADRMLDMGFIHDIRRVVRLLPEKRQTLMFSATFSGEITRLAGGYLNNPVKVEVSPANATADTVEQWVYPVDKKQKPALLSYLVKANDWSQVLVFTRTKHGANRLSQQLEKSGIPAAAIHGNKSQNARTRALGDFKLGKVQALVATDIAARGLDIEQLPQVVNFDLPNVAEDYVHRIGRTGRAGAAGRAYSLVSADEADYLRDIEKLIRQNLPREEVEGFVPDHTVPDTPPAPTGPRQPNRGRRSGGGRPGQNGSGQQARQRSGNGGNGGNSSGNGNGNGRRRGGRGRSGGASQGGNRSAS
ncbi:DEAD/DEAH box helicase [Parahaliea aestuarii]|uniref:ATP-dependent RNA helicase RhlE n=1 Tax=Parahaliea aestuarii TaxID=1852021 RepID=A0A5C8ZY83_9GAMM|nr:DEAD/DEAH box helicase [Parahaliea aestuarii]TXS93535.1 DEAD/DEAH box helicase [Parahaliea aestuarii]